MIIAYSITDLSGIPVHFWFLFKKMSTALKRWYQIKVLEELKGIAATLPKLRRKASHLHSYDSCITIYEVKSNVKRDSAYIHHWINEEDEQKVKMMNTSRSCKKMPWAWH